MVRKYLIIIIFSISCGRNTDLYFGESNNYYLSQASPSSPAIFNHNIFISGIYPDIISYKFDKDYIIAVQEPDKEALMFLLTNHLMSKFYFIEKWKDRIDSATKLNDTLILKDYKANKTLYEQLEHQISINNTEDDFRKASFIVDSLIKHNLYYKNIFNKKYNYWIINKKEKKLLGPFTYKEFQTKKMELDISLSIEQIK